MGDITSHRRAADGKHKSGYYNSRLSFVYTNLYSEIVCFFATEWCLEYLIVFSLIEKTWSPDRDNINVCERVFLMRTPVY